MNDLEILDVSEPKNEVEELSLEESNNSNIIKNDSPKKDKFMIGVYISLIVLVVFTIIIYFFGYELFKPIIKV